MDPLSITVSAASAVSLAIQTISALNNYAMTVKEAPAEVTALIEELQMLTETIHNIEETFKAKAKSSEGSENEVKEVDGNLQTLTKAIAGCQAHLAKALAVLDECGMTVTPADEGLIIKTGARYKRLFKRVKYPFNREYIQRLLMVVRDYKATLTLSLSLDGTKTIDVLQSTLARLETSSIRSEDKLTSLQDRNNQLLSHLISAMQSVIPPPSYGDTASNMEKHFEVPQHPTTTFVGRKVLLKEIEEHFKRASENNPGQRRCAIYGLGGSGKTQAALKFAFGHRAEYDHVFFINSVSERSAAHDFVRIHSLLQLTQAASDKDKIESVRRWLSRIDNTKWLLIFDNADDVDEVDLGSLLPIADHGDVLITSRDGRVDNPDIVTLALHMEMLSHDEAQELLLKRAAPKPGLDDEETTAISSIVQELGYLPLAIDQAGAYIQARQKTFKHYLELYQSRRESLLDYRSKLSKYQKTVLATWELTFNRIEEELPAVAELLLLLCQYNYSYIPDSLLKRGTSTQLSYGRDGEAIQLSADRSGVPQALVDLVSDEIAFDDAVEVLQSFSLVGRTTNNGFVLHPLVQFCGLMRANEDCRRSSYDCALRILSHSYPRGSLDDWNTSYSIEFLPQVEHCCERLKEITKAGETQEAASISATAISLLCSAYHFANTEWCEKFVNIAEALLPMISKDSGKVGLMTDYDFLIAFTTERQGKVLPELGKAEKGIEILSAFVTNRPDLSGDPDALDPDLRNPNHLANSMHGCVFVLLAHSLIVDGREEEALQYLLAWKPFEPPSFQERGVIRYRDRSLAEFYVSKKRWDEAEDVLKSLLVPDMEDASTYAGSLGEGWTIQQLAEIMIETGRYEAAGKLLFPAIATREAAGNNSRQDTVSLMLDLVACLLGQKALDVALTQLLKLRQTLKAKADSINNQSNSATSSQRMLTDLTYVWCLAARLSISLGDWKEAKSCWLKALEMAERVSYFNGSNHFVVSAIKVSLAHVYWTIGESPYRSVEDLELEVKATDLDNGRSINDVGISKEWVETLKSWRSGLGEDKIKT